MSSPLPKTSVSMHVSLVVGLVALGLICLVAFWILFQVDWDATVFVGFGEEATVTTEYARERLGDVMLRPQQGHDGKFFFVQANDPWVIEPNTNARVLDRPLYRSQRMLYPVLASGGGTLGPEAIVWGLLLVNLLAMGVGSWAVAHLAARMGLSRWWGLGFVLNLGFFSELTISGAGIVSGAAAFAAIAAFLDDHRAWGVALLSLAALSREAMLIAAAGTAWWLWRYRGERGLPLLVFVVPVSSVGLWGLYLRLRIAWDAGVSEVQEIGLPFTGIVQAFRDWLSDPFDLTVGLAILVLFILYTRRVLMSEHLVGWAFLGFVALGIVFTRQVWQSYFDIARAVAPLMTAFVVLILAPKRGFERGAVRS